MPIPTITSFLTATDGSAGRDKSDLRPVPDLNYAPTAAEYNAIKNALIALQNVRGLSDGSTAGSDLARVITLEDQLYGRRQGISAVNDFERTIALDVPITGSAGAGAALSQANTTGVQVSGHPGRIILSTGTTATGYTYANPSLYDNNLGTFGALKVGGGAISLRWVVNVVQLSAVAQEFILRVGMGDPTSNVPSNGAIFSYDRLTSVNWQARTYNGGGNTLASGGTNVPVATGWWMLEAIINTGGTQVDFYVTPSGGATTLIGSGVATLPPSDSTCPVIQIIKSAGLTAVTVEADLVSLKQIFASARW